jgi:hypothetical protein
VSIRLVVLTEVKGTADGGDDELNRPESTHPSQHGAALVEDGMDPDNMGGWKKRVRTAGWLSGAGIGLTRAAGKENGG